jgi:sec-independent protein translocase protein TatC
MSTKKYSKSAPEPTLKSFADHLTELRTRLAWVALVFIVASSLAYNVREQLVSIVLSPIGHQKLVYLTPAGGFSFIFQVSMYAGMLVTAPIAIYHIYRFVSPALPRHMNRLGIRMVLVSTALLVAGVSFGYFVAIPAALQFLTTFGGDFVTANLTADSYLSFVVAYLLGLGLLFQLPLLLVLWNWIQPFKPGGLLGTQRYVIVGSFIAAAMITPTPDALNQSLIALPIVAIYQLGVIAVFFMNKRPRRAKSHSTTAQKAPHRAPGALRADLEALTVELLPVPVAGPVRQTAKPIAAKTVAVPIKPSITSPTVVKQQQNSLDGFARVRTNALGVPRREGRPLVPSRPITSRPMTTGSGRPNTSIDGFGFAG